MEKDSKHRTITAEKLAMYRSFNGDNDNWSRSSHAHCNVMEDEDWHNIGNLLSELTLLKRNLATPAYSEKIRQKLLKLSIDQETARVLMEMA